MKEHSFPLELDSADIYNNLEVNNFNELFNDESIIEKRFGKTIRAELFQNKETGKLKRRVKEFKNLTVFDPNYSNEEQNDE